MFGSSQLHLRFMLGALGNESPKCRHWQFLYASLLSVRQVRPNRVYEGESAIA